MPSYIDRDKIKLNSLSWVDGEGDILVPLVEVRKAIAQTPTEGVVAVVRCKDCIHYQKGACNHFGYYTYAPDVDENDFCSYGSRKEQI